jgi:hypothetical protein
MVKTSKQEKAPAEMRYEELIGELHDIKKLLVLLLISNGTQKGEIEEILEIGDRNFAKFFKTDKLVERMREEMAKNGKKEH